MLDQIILGLIGIAGGVVAVVYARKLVESFGTMASAERYLGSGGTYTAIRLIGVFVALLSFLYMVGLLDNLVIGILRGIGLIN